MTSFGELQWPKGKSVAIAKSKAETTEAGRGRASGMTKGVLASAPAPAKKKG